MQGSSSEDQFWIQSRGSRSFSRHDNLYFYRKMSRKKKTIEIPGKQVEGWENAEKAIGENADLLSERTYSLAAGGLALSFTVMSFIVGEEKSALGWQALAIWGLFLLCIILDTISIFSAKRKAEKLELFFRERRIKGRQCLRRR